MKVFAEHMTKLLNGDEDDPKVRAAARASGRFIGSCPDSIYSVYVKEVGVAVQTAITLSRAIAALETAPANSLSAPFRRRKLTYGPWNLRIVRP